MRPALMGFFLSVTLVLGGCHDNARDNTPQATPETLSGLEPSRVSSKKTCCGKDVCTCPACECCGACEAHIVKVSVTKDVPQVMPSNK